MLKSDHYICIFGGGAVRGIAYIGSIQALRELQITCDSFVGSSVGAIFAVLFALDLDNDDLKKIFYDFNAFMFKDINFTLGADFALCKGDIFENWIRDIIEKNFYGIKYKKGENPQVCFRDFDKDIYILSTDLNSNTQFVFSKKNTPDVEIAKAVRISASFPGLMKPVEFDNKLLVDGDLAKCLPLWKACSDLTKFNSRILEFRLEGCKDCFNLKNFVDYFNTVYSSMSNFCSEQIINMYKDKDNFDYILINTADILLLDFQMHNKQKDELIQNGYITTLNYFTKSLVQKKQILLPLYIHLLYILRNIKNCIKKGKISSAKRTLTDYICSLTTEYNLMDDNFLDEFDKFKKSFFNDIKNHPLLPITALQNKTAHIKNIQGLIEYLEFITEDFKLFIDKYSNYKLFL